MTNAYGISAYFPYKRTSNVDKAVKTYNAIGMDEEYSQCIREFASMEVGGQLASGGTGSPLTSLFRQPGVRQLHPEFRQISPSCLMPFLETSQASRGCPAAIAILYREISGFEGYGRLYR